MTLGSITMNAKKLPPSPDDTMPEPLNSRDLEDFLRTTSPRDTMPCPPPAYTYPPPPPSSLAPISIDLTADYLEDP